MTRKVYAIHDDKIGSFNPPFVEENDASVVRQFGDLVTSGKDTIFCKHAPDFSVWYLGTFDDESGEFTNGGTDARRLVSGSDFVKEK